MESERESDVSDDVDWGLISEQEGVGIIGELQFGDDDQDGDIFRIDVSLSILDSETDDIDVEFVEVVREIEGKKSFPCPKCAKVCKCQKVV